MKRDSNETLTTLDQIEIEIDSRLHSLSKCNLKLMKILKHLEKLQLLKRNINESNWVQSKITNESESKTLKKLDKKPNEIVDKNSGEINKLDQILAMAKQIRRIDNNQSSTINSSNNQPFPKSNSSRKKSGHQNSGQAINNLNSVLSNQIDKLNLSNNSNASKVVVHNESDEKVGRHQDQSSSYYRSLAKFKSLLQKPQTILSNPIHRRLLIQQSNLLSKFYRCTTFPKSIYYQIISKDITPLFVNIFQINQSLVSSNQPTDGSNLSSSSSYHTLIQIWKHSMETVLFHWKNSWNGRISQLNPLHISRNDRVEIIELWFKCHRLLDLYQQLVIIQRFQIHCACHQKLPNSAENERIVTPWICYTCHNNYWIIQENQQVQSQYPCSSIVKGIQSFPMFTTLKIRYDDNQCFNHIGIFHKYFKSVVNYLVENHVGQHQLKWCIKQLKLCCTQQHQAGEDTHRLEGMREEWKVTLKIFRIMDSMLRFEGLRCSSFVFLNK